MVIDVPGVVDPTEEDDCRLDELDEVLPWTEELEEEAVWRA